jgi:hypothetical protein
MSFCSVFKLACFQFLCNRTRQDPWNVSPHLPFPASNSKAEILDFYEEAITWTLPFTVEPYNSASVKSQLTVTTVQPIATGLWCSLYQLFLMVSL